MRVSRVLFLLPCLFLAVSGQWKETKVSDRKGNELSGMGRSVAVSGNTIAVASPGDSNGPAGSVLIYTRQDPDANMWIIEAELTRNKAGDLFGYTIALHGDRLFVSHLRGTRHRVSHYFRRNGTWHKIEEIDSQRQMSGDCFACAMSVSSNALSVGAPASDHRNRLYRGTVYMFTPAATGKWTKEQVLRASDTSTTSDFSFFGRSVGLDEDGLVLAVGSEDNAGGNSAGALYIFMRPDDSSKFTEATKITRGGPGDLFGWDVAIRGKYIYASSPGANGFRGEVHVFRSSGSFRHYVSLGAADQDIDRGYPQRFGNALSAGKDFLVIGAPGADGEKIDTGAAYVFQVDFANDDLLALVKLQASDGDNIDSFGFDVAVSDDTVVAGAFRGDGRGRNSGSAYVFDKSDGDAPPAVPVIQINCGGATTRYTATDGSIWKTDRYFSGGSTFARVRRYRGTKDDVLYSTERHQLGSALIYNVPVVSGSYRVDLLFAEMYHRGPGLRVFDVHAEGELILNDFDVAATAGGRFTAVIESFEVVVSDNILTLEFDASLDNGQINAIGLYLIGTDELQINCGATRVYKGHDGSQWEPDKYYSGGRTSTRIRGLLNTKDDPLYHSGRYEDGEAIVYDIPVSNGMYQVDLLFAEMFHNAAGVSVFDIFAEGELVLNDFDVWTKATRRFRAYVETLEVVVTDGSLSLHMTASVGSAQINAIRVVPARN